MRFWDASAIVPLLVAEPTTRRLKALAASDPDMLVWWGSEVECVSALARFECAAALDAKGTALAFKRLNELAKGWHEIEPSEIVREIATRFLRVHPLLAADALQLAAAFVAAERRPSSLEIITLDDLLAEAARKEGFALVDLTTSRARIGVSFFGPERGGVMQGLARAILGRGQIVRTLSEAGGWPVIIITLLRP